MREWREDLSPYDPYSERELSISESSVCETNKSSLPNGMRAWNSTVWRLASSETCIAKLNYRWASNKEKAYFSLCGAAHGLEGAPKEETGKKDFVSMAWYTVFLALSERVITIQAWSLQKELSV